MIKYDTLIEWRKNKLIPHPTYPDLPISQDLTSMDSFFFG